MPNERSLGLVDHQDLLVLVPPPFGNDDTVAKPDVEKLIARTGACAFTGKPAGDARMPPGPKDEVVDRAAAALQPVEQARPRRFKQFELNRPAGLLLDDYGTLADASAAHDVADPHLHQGAATQLAVDCQTEEGTVSKAMLLIQLEA
jgi:hypothetical protein